MSNTKTDKYSEFMLGYSGKELIKHHRLTETGLWRILGADSNCDMGGPHHMPELGIVEGKLDDVIHYAVTIPRFWAWGSGDITKVPTPIKITSESNARRTQAEQKIVELEAQLEKARNELKGM
jgi:hypothetical protein